MRRAQISRATAETDVRVDWELDGTGVFAGTTGCPFLDHMLTLFACHGRFDLTVTATGDTQVDDHHTTEDVAICLGRAFAEALGDKKGVRRYGDTLLPMDEALILTAVDLSGRGGCYTELQIPAQKVGTFDTELCEEFWVAFAREAALTLHIRQLAGSNSHHIIEGVFKSAARSLRTAVSVDAACGDAIPSTKGTLV